ncbi:hypothetical protein SRHO_G00271590 [Serrasalmus rhombeus]
MDLEASEIPHTLVYVDEAEFNLNKIRHCGRNIIGQRATVDVTGQCGGNITMCAAVSENGAVHHVPAIEPYNTPDSPNYTLMFGAFKVLLHR